MSALTFTLREAPLQRVDLAALTPDRLLGFSESDISALELTTRVRLCAGELSRSAWATQCKSGLRAATNASTASAQA